MLTIVNTTSPGEVLDFIIELDKPMNSVTKELFSYFNKRTVDSIRNHVCTFLVYLENISHPVAYGHLDKEDNTIWLGVCVLPAFHHLGLGRKIVKALIQYAVTHNITGISLTVKKSNKKALALFKDTGFVETSREKEIIYMRRAL